MLIKMTVIWKSEFSDSDHKNWVRKAIDVARIANPDLFRSIKWQGNLIFIFNPISGDEIVKNLITHVFNFPDEIVMRNPDFSYTVTWETLTAQELENYWK